MGANSPEYQAQYRAENPDYVNTQRKRAQARTAALRTLRERHETEYRELLKKELKRYRLAP
jgi:hypothetical protein